MLKAELTAALAVANARIEQLRLERNAAQIDLNRFYATERPSREIKSPSVNTEPCNTYRDRNGQRFEKRVEYFGNRAVTRHVPVAG